ncbi:MAG TPA: hypothetical protein DER01_15970 [Phycisphaerales bacterium]|nr:hypothetical protein [Phycisphaerales bacterium]
MLMTDIHAIAVGPITVIGVLAGSDRGSTSKKITGKTGTIICTNTIASVKTANTVNTWSGQCKALLSFTGPACVVDCGIATVEDLDIGSLHHLQNAVYHYYFRSNLGFDTKRYAKLYLFEHLTI